MAHKNILNPTRLRKIGRGFSFIPHRFLNDGFLSALSQDELILYLFFVIVADRYGLSFYSHRSICRLTGINPINYEVALGSLIEKDMICSEEPLVQVLELPTRPLSRELKD